MAAPIVIPAKTNPINDAIQFAGNSIKQAISLMQATKQLQVMEDANRVDAGKTLITNAFNMYTTLATEKGSMAAWDQTKDLFASGFKALGMDDQNIADFAKNMSEGAVSYQDLQTVALNLFSGGSRPGTFSDAPASAFTAAAGPSQTATEATSKGATPTPAPAPAPASTVTPGTATKTVETTTQVTTPNPDAPANAYLTKVYNDYVGALPGAMQKGKQADLAKTMLTSITTDTDKQVKAGTMTPETQKTILDQAKRGIGLGEWAGKPFVSGIAAVDAGTGAPAKPGFLTASPTITTQQTLQKDFKLTGPLPTEVDTLDKKIAWFETQKAAFEDMGASHETASMLASAAIMLAPVVTKPAASTKTGTATTTPATQAAPVVANVTPGRPMQFPPSPPANFSEVKRYVADDTIPDKQAYQGFKSYYEWWAKSVAGAEFKGSDIRISKGINDYLQSLPTLGQRVTPETANAFIQALGGQERFMDSLNVNLVNAEANKASAAAQTAEQARLGEKFFTWNFKVPGMESLNGKALNAGQMQVAMQALDSLIQIQASSDSSFKVLYDTYQADEKFVADQQDAMWKAALAKNPGAPGGEFTKMEGELYKTNSDYQYRKDNIRAFRKNFLSASEGDMNKLDLYVSRWGPFQILGMKQTTITSGPALVPGGAQGGTTQGQAAQVDSSKVDSYVQTFGK